MAPIHADTGRIKLNMNHKHCRSTPYVQGTTNIMQNSDVESEL